jgi:hypothetical protein
VIDILRNISVKSSWALRHCVGEARQLGPFGNRAAVETRLPNNLGDVLSFAMQRPDPIRRPPAIKSEPMIRPRG